MTTRFLASIFFLVSTAGQVASSQPNDGVFSIGDEGAVGDSKVGYNCSVAAGANPSLTCNDSSITFSASDVGHTIWVYGSNSAQYYLATPNITIGSVTNAQTVVLSGTLTQSVSNGMIQLVGATDNSTAIQNTINAACSTATADNPATVFSPAGVYGYTIPPQIPSGCSNLKLQASGKVVWLNTTIRSNTSGAAGYGQGAQALVISGGGSGFTTQPAGTSITAGSNQLTCTTCSFTSANVGQPIYVQSAGPDGLPLWTTITAVSGNVATLANNAQTTMSAAYLGGPLLTWGYQLNSNIEIAGMQFQNVGYYYNPNNGYVSSEGYPVVAANPGSVLQGFYFHDSVITTATNSCYRGDGVSDQFNYQNVTCYGGADVGMSFYGAHSNGSVTNSIVDNTQWPVPNTWEVNAYTIKGATHVNFVNPIARCNCYSYIFNQSDIAAFQVTIQGADFDAEGSAAIGISSLLSTGMLVDGGQIRNSTGFALFFASELQNGVQNLTVRGFTGVNVISAVTMTDYSGTGQGVKNIVFENNQFQTTGGNGANIGNVAGVNFWEGNSFTGNGNAAAAWILTSSGAAGNLNVMSNNFDTGYSGQSLFDSSVAQGTLQDYHWAATAPMVGTLVKTSNVGDQSVAALSINDTEGAIGIAVNTSGSGSSGNVMVQQNGRAEVITDGDTALGDQLTYSTVIPGAVHDTGSSTPPPQPVAIVGTAAFITTHVNISSLSTNASSIMTVTTSSAHKLIVGEPFSITGAVFNGSPLNVAGVVSAVLSSTSFTFQSRAAANATGSGGQVNPPTQVNLQPQNPVNIAGSKTSVVLTGQFTSLPARTVVTNAGSTATYFVSADVAQDSSVTCATYGSVALYLEWQELDGNFTQAATVYTFGPTLSGSPQAQRLGPYGVLIPPRGTIWIATAYTPGTGCTGNGSTYTVAAQVQ